MNFLRRSAAELLALVSGMRSPAEEKARGEARPRSLGLLFASTLEAPGRVGVRFEPGRGLTVARSRREG